MEYFEEQVQAGKWDEIEQYLLGFTNIDDNIYSVEIFFQIRKQKYLEALDRNDQAEAFEILMKDLKMFSAVSEESFKGMTHLLTLDNFRQNGHLFNYGDTKSERNTMLVGLKRLIGANPSFQDKLTFPTFQGSPLQNLMNQSLNSQCELCKNPHPGHDTKAHFNNHNCVSGDEVHASLLFNSPLARSIQKAGLFSDGTNNPFYPVVFQHSKAITEMPSSNPSLPYVAVAAGSAGLVQPPNAVAFLNCPWTSSSTLQMNDQISENSRKRACTRQSDQVTNQCNEVVHKSKLSDDAEELKNQRFLNIVDSSQLKALRLPDPMISSKVMQLIYTNSGNALLALCSNAVHKFWKWQENEHNPSGKSTASVPPQLALPPNGCIMTNDSRGPNPPEESAACIALSKNDSYVVSASGGKVSLFNLLAHRVMTTFIFPPPAVTYLAFHPRDNNIIAIGLENCTILIYNVRTDKVLARLKGHRKQITGLAFSKALSALVSSGADAQLCMWGTGRWKKRKANFIQAPSGYPSSLTGETKVQFDHEQKQLLVVHESQIAIYDSKLECLRSWFPRDSSHAAISTAIYSCNSLLVYSGFHDGAIGVFYADSLILKCRIARSAYVPTFIARKVSNSCPVAMTPHPIEADQFAFGTSDGSVYVIEQSSAGGPKWNDPSSPTVDVTP